MNIKDTLLGRRAVLAGVAAAVVVGVSACSTAGTASSTGGSQKTITVATSNDAPFSFTEGGGDTLKGIDGEMINAIAEAKGWKVEVFVTDFNTLISALQAKKADVIVDAMYITDERKKQINFTDPWYTEGEGLLVPADSDIKTRDDLSGKVVGAQTGTAFADFIKTLGAKDTKFFDSQAALVAAVANKQVDAAITDSAVLAYSFKQNPNPKVKLVSPYTPHFPGTIGAGVRKDDTQLLDDLNSGLADLKKSPKYLEILKKYGLDESNEK
ncbi:amino acid ABC transporter substrate-binding protein [Sinomonas cellulolyticus]|uniref:Amino acid ABC transporter substrate-binding protein n=1 Tax=Sinomonas cellulolyticus TaxID=2801916 RepID=A0ABS1K3Q7_9MICC|nr:MULTISPECIES: ABC transporter substrate-binding protein [Sinomonas]MBL0706265.1 amino acid ABC transporter substrate-binding protein [Sinomonas cellulolyticus]GHG61137.1 amino acid ABC transporter substrate-binding protein [Sinomonas sp. KCTC 49339]